jgi:hypothetical protein
MELAVTPNTRFAISGHTVAIAESRRIIVRDLESARERDFVTSWDIDRIELSSDAGYLLAIGDLGRRGSVWAVASGAVIATLGGDDQPRGTLQAGFCRDIGTTFILSTQGIGRLIAIDLATGSQRFWAGLDGIIVFRCDRIIDVGSGWIALLGYRAGEQYDSIITIPFARLSTNEAAVQEALLDRSTLHDSGGRLAIGPCGSGKVVVFRDAEDLEVDDEDNPSRGPVEGFKGLCVWDLESVRLVERIEYDGPIESGARVGGNERRLAIQGRAQVDVVERGTGTKETFAGGAVALDPERLTAVLGDGSRIDVLDLRSATSLPS